ncbi:toxin-activating lysine-acyltransferase [Candidatus Nitrospira neomarina]|uniref:RTX toxin-activating lysine-acyltransferase n=1 Tax=Candidatus Nitrospira neomarina TaxID=3020899 RepID=A0AA96GGR0_9BACT|nr:toxin-activating lysine-acyltransferase [Candidatus Nitrospira neomarina]WNM62094.1 toxin-activating lysine-acyltransferase [Candidatus Nitrospira neomarina]
MMTHMQSEAPFNAESQLAGSEGALNQNHGTGQLTNNGSTSNPSAMDPSQRARVATATFGEIVALLCFSPVFKHLSLADLEWLVIPALATNQVTVVRGKVKDQNELMVPIGLALWAHVSEDVDKKLEGQQKAHIPFRLAPQDWKSGEIPWLLAVLAPKEISLGLVKKLEDSVFKDKQYKRYALMSDRAHSVQTSPTPS